MIETRAGLEAVDAIVGTEGLDGVYIGPSDLSLGIGGHPSPRLEDPRVLEAIRTVRAAAEFAQKVCGLHCLDPEDAAGFAAEGFPMVTTGMDAAFLRGALSAAVATARGRG
jgi:4-hydroxy-2-oxoheptanedioate aldolase